MLDVIFPISKNNVSVACVSLDALLLNTNVEMRLIAIFDGGKRTEYVAIENELRRSGKDWVAMHQVQPIYLNKCITEALATKVIHDRVLTLMPGVVINDKSWFMKMCMPFGKDLHAGMTIAGSFDTPSATLPPHRLKSALIDYLFHRFAIIKDWSKKRIQQFEPSLGQDVVTALVGVMMDSGFNVWRVPSVNYQLVDYKEHALS